MRGNYNLLKLTYDDYVLLFKSGNFYVVLDNDAILMNKIFNYKIIKMENFIKCGFPLTSITKVTKVLDDNKINYLIVDEGISLKKKFKTNNYNKYIINQDNFEFYIDRINRINSILIKNVINKDINTIITKMEEIVCKIN